MSIEVSVVIPVYNEEAILEEALSELLTNLRQHEPSFEVIISANGCVDETEAIAERLAQTHPELKLHRCPEPDYGEALKQGIEMAQGNLVLCEEIDLCDDRFHRTALAMLRADEELAMVVGSKAMRGSRDRRPMTRRAATRVINGLLWASLGFQGSDTHGLKGFLRDALLPIVDACIVDKDLFASELVIRAERAGLDIQEIPIELEEQRSPPINLVRRVPGVLKGLGRLVFSKSSY